MTVNNDKNAEKGKSRSCAA